MDRVRERSPERVGRYDYGDGNVKWAEPPMSISGQTEYVRIDLYEGLARALTDIAESDDIENMLDPARNKRIARAALITASRPLPSEERR